MSIHQVVKFRCTARRVFQALTSAEQFAEATGKPAEIDPDPGGAFSCFDGMILGRTIEVAPDTRLVQAWRVADWPEGVYSIAKFEVIDESGSECELIFDHTGYPPEHQDHLEQGWHDNYWAPLKKYLES